MRRSSQHWVQHQVSAAACGWQSTNKSRVNRPTDHGNKYLKISNSCVSFESNRIASNYSIRFEISNIRTSLLAMVTATAREENGESCVTVGPVTRTAGILTYVVKGPGC